MSRGGRVPRWKSCHTVMGDVLSRVSTWVGIISYSEGGSLDQGEYLGGDHIIVRGEMSRGG